MDRPQELVQVELFTDGKSANFGYPTYEQLAARQNVLRGIYATSVFPMGRATLRTNGEVKTIAAVLVTGNYFQLLGVHASFGRTLANDDNRRGAPAVAVISDSFWQWQFGRRAAAIGRTLEINHAAATIAGVAPPSFFGEARGFDPMHGGENPYPLIRKGFLEPRFQRAPSRLRPLGDSRMHLTDAGEFSAT